MLRLFLLFSMQLYIDIELELSGLLPNLLKYHCYC
jgi:hypothetical protein